MCRSLIRLLLSVRCGCVGTMWISLFLVGTTVRAAERPNVVLVLLDDMGYGDPGCYNGDSKCRTPHIDSLARDGLRMTDAHSSGAWCTPSRLGLLTGMHPFRSPLRWQTEPVIPESHMTVPEMLRQAGYRTAMVGKWHLGFVDADAYSSDQPLRGGPVDRGFDSYYGIPASLDIPPYFYIRNDSMLGELTARVAASDSPGWSPIQGAFWRAGRATPEFRHEEVLDELAESAVAEIERLSMDTAPFFLYVPFTGPHTPWLPAERFAGAGEADLYSEFVAHVDDAVGRVLAALQSAAVAEDTLVILASDNGPVWYEKDEVRFGHRSTGPWRGMKGDFWEGGHRVPFLIRWPGKVRSGTSSGQLIDFVDVLPTLAEILEIESDGTGPIDGISFASAIRGEAIESESLRPRVQHHSGKVLREGPWKLIDALGSGGFTDPRSTTPQPGGAQGQLYNLEEDPGEQNNLWLDHPERVERMLSDLARLTDRPRD